MLRTAVRQLLKAFSVWCKAISIKFIAAVFRILLTLLCERRSASDPDLSKPAAPSRPPQTVNSLPAPHPSSSQIGTQPESIPYIACSNMPRPIQSLQTQSPSQNRTQPERKTSLPLPRSRRTQRHSASIDPSLSPLTTSPPISPISPTFGPTQNFPLQNDSSVHIRRRPVPPRQRAINNGLGIVEGAALAMDLDGEPIHRDQDQILDFRLSDSEDAYARFILDPDGRPICTSEPIDIGTLPIQETEDEVSQRQNQRGTGGNETLSPELRESKPIPTGDIEVLGSSSPAQTQSLRRLEALQQRESSGNSPGVSGQNSMPRTREAQDASIQSQVVVQNSLTNGNPQPRALPLTSTEMDPEFLQAVANPAHIIVAPKEIKTFQPSSNKRYNRNVVIKDKAGSYDIPPLKSLSFHEDDKILHWMHYTQPEGQPYFVNPFSSREMCFVTEADMFDPKSREEINRFVVQFKERYEAFKAAFHEKLERRRTLENLRENSAPVLGTNTGARALPNPASAQDRPPMNSPVREKEGEEEEDPTLTLSSLPANIEVVLEIDDGEWKYYMVDLDRRMIFWIDMHVTTEDTFPPHFGVQIREHFRHAFSSEFWTHVEVFPCHRTLFSGVIDELMGILLQMRIDSMTSKTSTACFDRDELDHLVSSVRDMQKLLYCRKARQYVVCGCARLMSMFSSEHIVNFWGFPGARLSINQSIRGAHPRSFSPDSTNTRGIFFRVLSPLLFFAPENFMRKMEDLYVDKVIRARPWRAFVKCEEIMFNEFIILATVILNANVGYLSIPTVQSDQQFPDLWMTSSSVVSICSMIVSLGSIIIGLLLVRHQRAAGEYAEEAVNYIQSRSHPTRGLEMLAVLYSLPYALLLWGLILFTIAVVLNCFTISGSMNTLLTNVVYSAIWGMVFSLILITVINANEDGVNELMGIFTRNKLVVCGPKKLLAVLRERWTRVNSGEATEGESHELHFV